MTYMMHLLMIHDNYILKKKKKNNKEGEPINPKGENHRPGPTPKKNQKLPKKNPKKGRCPWEGKGNPTYKGKIQKPPQKTWKRGGGGKQRPPGKGKKGGPPKEKHQNPGKKRPKKKGAPHPQKQKPKSRKKSCWGGGPP